MKKVPLIIMIQKPILNLQERSRLLAISLSILANMKHYREKKMPFTTIEIQIRPIQPFSKSNLYFLIQYTNFIILGGFFVSHF